MIGLPLEARMGEPEVVASLVSFLVKPESHFITGAPHFALDLDLGLCHQLGLRSVDYR